MKTAFSTLGCPNWSFAEIFSTATDLGFNGIEFRGVENEIYMPKVKEFSKSNIGRTKSKFAAAKIEIPVFSSGAVMSGDDMNNALKEAYDYIDLAADFGGRYIRVLTDKNAAPSVKIDEAAAIKNLDKVCGYGKDKNVGILIETNGVYSNSDNILSLLKSVKRDNLFIIWDVHHTCRYGKETPKYTAQKLSGYIKHVHLKDSFIKDGKLVYAMPGEGDIPVINAVKELKKAGYDGYLSLEWVKRWAADLAEPGIVFPHYLFYIRDILSSI